MDFPQISSTSRGEVPSQTQRASEITHLLRFHVNVYFGRCVRLMFPPLNILEKRLKRTVFFFSHPPFEKTESIDGSKTNRSHMIAYLLSPADFFFFFFMFWVRLRCVSGRHMFSTLWPQVEFILDSASVHWTITHQFSHIRLLHRRPPIEENTSTHFFFQKFPNHIPLFLCVWVRETDK